MNKIQLNRLSFIMHKQLCKQINHIKNKCKSQYEFNTKFNAKEAFDLLIANIYKLKLNSTSHINGPKTFTRCPFKLSVVINCCVYCLHLIHWSMVTCSLVQPTRHCDTFTPNTTTKSPFNHNINCKVSIFINSVQCYRSVQNLNATHLSLTINMQNKHNQS